MKSCTVVLLGVTGDLAKRKLIPAIFSLVSRKNIEKCVLVGAAIDDTSMKHILNDSKQFIENYDDVLFERILKHSYYHKLDFNSADDFDALSKHVDQLEKEHYGESNRLVYIASMPSFFCEITHHCATSGLVKKTSNDDIVWHRIVYEKPFGRDSASAKAINECIETYFNEDQIYRVDHYLTKEIVESIVLVRFTNCVFEPLWNNKYIDQINIILNEKLCIEGRGAYYDKYGAIRDVVQNHMLELLSLIAMESPEMLTGDYIRDERVKVLQNVAFVDGILGQYDGYKKEKKVDPNSKTETFASLLCNVNNNRWKGVPFYLRTGKCLGAKKTEIQIKFKKIDCLLVKGCPIESNYLTIGIYPKGTLYLSLNAKKPGELNQIAPVEMEYCHSCRFKEILPESYEVIFQEVINGEKSISVRFDEIECLWEVVDRIYEKQLPLYNYSVGSQGPQEVSSFEEKYGLKVKK